MCAGKEESSISFPTLFLHILKLEQAVSSAACDILIAVYNQQNWKNPVVEADARVYPGYVDGVVAKAWHWYFH